LRIEAELTLEDRESLRDALNPNQIARDRAEADARRDAERVVMVNEAEQVADGLVAADAEITIRLDELLLSISSMLDARMRYARSREGGASLQRRARKLEIDCPTFDSFSDRVRSDPSARTILNAYRVSQAAQIR
jgi:hypothetical protein